MTPDDQPRATEPELPPYKIEGARSSRSKCKSCKKPIQKDAVRLGILIDGPFGQGYLWHHLKCAAKRQADHVEEAYAGEYFEAGLELPPIDSLRQLAAAAEKKKAEKKTAPYAEVAPTGRSKCRHCDQLIDRGSFRIGLLREVEFYGQTRQGVVNVHPGCVAAELDADHCMTEALEFAEGLKLNSRGLEPEEIQAALDAVGDLG